jgi:hypothetical protein
MCLIFTAPHYASRLSLMAANTRNHAKLGVTQHAPVGLPNAK